MAELEVSLRWSGSGLEFEGGAAEGQQIVLDGNGRAGVSPVQALGLSLAGCMASDVVLILQKGRVAFEQLAVDLAADRRSEPPRYITRIVVTFSARGMDRTDEDKLRRAVALSQETYCSVLHTLRSDIEVRTEIGVT